MVDSARVVTWTCKSCGRELHGFNEVAELASNTRAKKIYVKLIPSTPVTKGRLAAMVRVMSKIHSAHDDHLKEWKKREDGDTTSEAGWSDVVPNDPNDQIGDCIESPESLEYPFEMVRPTNGLQIKRQGDPTSPLTKGFLLGRLYLSAAPDSEVDFWPHLTSEQLRESSSGPAGIQSIWTEIGCYLALSSLSPDD